MFERINYKPEGTRRSRWIVLETPTERKSPLGNVVIGQKVDTYGTHTGHTYVISVELITKRTPMYRNQTFGRLERAVLRRVADGHYEYRDHYLIRDDSRPWRRAKWRVKVKGSSAHVGFYGTRREAATGVDCKIRIQQSGVGLAGGVDD